MVDARQALCACLLFASVGGWCDDQRLKIEGTWDGETFQVDRIRQRDPRKSSRQIRVAGMVSSMRHADRKMEIGPVLVRWDSAQDASLSSIVVGDAISVNALQLSEHHFVLTDFEAVELDGRDEVEVIGVLTGSVRKGDWTELHIAGILAKTPRRLFSNGHVRLQRLDDRRPDDQFTTTIVRVRMTIGGEFGLKADAEGDRDLNDEDSDGELAVSAELQLESFFEVTERLSAFAEFKLEESLDYELPLRSDEKSFELNRGELWFYIDQPFGLPLGLQIGRQNFAEDREWWWDTDLDAVRLFMGSRLINAEVAVAEEIARETLNENDDDAEDLNVTRLLARMQFRPSSLLSLEGFLLVQDDHSSAFDALSILRENREDESDANLTWLGARLSGDAGFGEALDVEYWIDFANVSGKETIYEFDDIGQGFLVVESARELDRSGTGFDAGASLTWSGTAFTRLEEPTLTLRYAAGSGSSGGERTFRQTGLHDNNGRFNGVDRFRYYGEVTRPDLENLIVSTVAFGFQFGVDSSVEFLLHGYEQDRLSTTHPLRLDADANLQSKKLGNEFNFVIGIESWQHFEFEAVAAAFFPGPAFHEHDTAWLVALKLDYNF